MIKLPAIDNAVHTTPPIIRAATIPTSPRKPTATITTDAKIRVISVMPDTGFEPTMAIALAATVVKRKAMIATSKMPTTANNRLPCITPNQKNKKITANVTNEPIAIILNEMSRCVRTCSTLALLPPFSSLPASDTAPRIIPHDLMMPIMPDMAIPPMPMLRPYSRKMVSGDIEPTV